MRHYEPVAAAAARVDARVLAAEQRDGLGAARVVGRVAEQRDLVPACHVVFTFLQYSCRQDLAPASRRRGA